MTELQQIPFLAPPPPGKFVGRADLIQNIKRDILTNQVRAIGLGLLPGIGKTALAAHLAHDQDIRSHFKDGVLWSGLGQRPNIPALLGEWAISMGIESNQIVSMDSAEARQRGLQEKIGNRHMLLVVDDVWDAQDFEWFRMEGVPNCTYLVITRHRAMLDTLSGVTAYVVPVLSKDEGMALLSYLAPEAIASNVEESEALVSAVGGMPLALMLMGRYLNKHARGGQKRRIRQAIEKLHNEEERLTLESVQSPLFQPEGPLKDAPLSLLAIISVTYSELDRSAQHALLSLAIHRPKPSVFAGDFPQALGVTPDDFQRLLAFGLVDVARQTEEDLSFYKGYGPGYSSRAISDLYEHDQGRAFYEMPNVINDFARSRIDAEFSVEQKRVLHEKAAHYYSGWLQQFENMNNDATPYKRMYRYVWPTWQFAMGQLIDHLGELAAEDAQILFANLYFDAFWWWGKYLEFPFCDQLLKWGERYRQEKGWQWLDHVIEFHKVYRQGYYITYDYEDRDAWHKVQRALEQLRAYGSTGTATVTFDDLDHEHRHLWVMTNIYLAEAFQYQDIHDPRAEHCFQEALLLLENEDNDSNDVWNIPWLQWHLAQLYLLQNRLDDAQAMAEKSRMLAREQIEDPCQRDNEIIANDYRVLADIFFTRGDYDNAFRNYAYAVLYAWGFHTCPNAPNFYSVQFHTEMNTRTRKRLENLVQMGEESEAERACSALNRIWAHWSEVITEKPGFEKVFQRVPDHALYGLLHAHNWTQLERHLCPLIPTEDIIDQGENSTYYALTQSVFLSALAAAPS